jgi:DNA-binding beta-propeller fold protein YncE
MIRNQSWLLAASASLLSVVAQAAEPKTTVVASGIDNPSGLAVQHSTGNIFVAARSGVHRLVLGEKPALHTEVGSFDTDIYGKGPKYNIGPLGVAMLGDDHLVVADGSHPDEKEVVLVMKVGKESPKTPHTAKDAAFVIGPIKAGKDSAKGEGNYYGVAINKQAIFITCNGDDTKGWVAKSDLQDGKPGALTPYIATKVATNVDAPVGITFSPEGKQLVISQMGEMNVANDSLLTMYNPADGKLIKALKTGLHDIAGLAYSPKTGKLYVVDFAWVKTSEGGLFELTVDGDKVTAKKVLSLDKPTSLAFGKDGHLYITEFGTSTDDKPAGKIVRIDADL